MVKRYANDICNTIAFERSIISEVIAHHLSDLANEDTFNFEPRLLSPMPSSRKVHDFVQTELDMKLATSSMSSVARVSEHVVCSKGDVVLLSSDDGRRVVAGQIWFHVDVYGTPLSIVSVWDIISMDASTGTATWHEQLNPTLVTLTDIRSAVAFVRPGPNVVRTLVPCHLRASLVRP